jgi:hypothetical protein
MRPAPSDEERKRIVKAKNPADTLARGIGNELQIDLLFAALANASGLEARPAMLADRATLFFEPKLEIDSLLSRHAVAVKGDAGWRFFAPGAAHVAYGMMPWQLENEMALVADERKGFFVATPATAPERSLEKRTAKLRLAEDGTLEGDIRSEYIGHPAVVDRVRYEDESPDTRESSVRESVRARLSAAEVTAVSFENLEDAEKPLVLTYHVRVPGYAARTGKRLFLGPSYFRRGRAALFPSSARELPIFFPFQWSESDEVSLELPDGFVAEGVASPQALSMGKTASYAAELTAEGRMLKYTRQFTFSGELFEPSSYPDLKKVFDKIHQRDDVQVTCLKGSK